MLENVDEQMMAEKLPNKLTEEMIKSMIVSEHFQKLGRKTMVCCLTLKNGFEVIGSSSCVEEQNFDADTGQLFAKENAINQILWQLEGYLLQQLRFQDKHTPNEV